jgi:hypothetical protein
MAQAFWLMCHHPSSGVRLSSRQYERFASELGDTLSQNKMEVARKALEERRKDPEFKAIQVRNMVEGRRRQLEDPQGRVNARLQMLSALSKADRSKRHRCPDCRRRDSERMKQLWSTPEGRAKMLGRGI